MAPLSRFPVIALLCCLALACNRQAPELPTGSDAETEEDSGREGVDTVVVDPNAAFVGSALTETGEIATPQREFNVGDTVYLSVPSKGRRLGSGLEVFWFHSDGRSRRDDQKRIEGPFTALEFVPEEAGQYNVEVAVDGRTVGLVEFEVR